jgi:hypothetical protein
MKFQTIQWVSDCCLMPLTCMKWVSDCCLMPLTCMKWVSDCCLMPDLYEVSEWLLFNATDLYEVSDCFLMPLTCMKWVSDCCLMSSQPFFSYIMVRKSFISTWWWYRNWIFIVLAHWNKSAGRQRLPTQDI